MATSREIFLNQVDESHAFTVFGLTGQILKKKDAKKEGAAAALGPVRSASHPTPEKELWGETVGMRLYRDPHPTGVKGLRVEPQLCRLHSPNRRRVTRPIGGFPIKDSGFSFHVSPQTRRKLQHRRSALCGE